MKRLNRLMGFERRYIPLWILSFAMVAGLSLAGVSAGVALISMIGVQFAYGVVLGIRGAKRGRRIRSDLETELRARTEIERTRPPVCDRPACYDGPDTVASRISHGCIPDWTRP